MSTMQLIKKQVEENSVILYMKGSPNSPQCGFSARTVQALMECGQKFAFVNVLENQKIRQDLPKFGHWPTFPQLWVNGDLLGGCDIVTELHQKGELKPLIDKATLNDSK